ncbi:fatty acid hydroxylase superfamily domain-containing protein [Ditylenchus destructor]|uniref:Alkylglycerol monooxygenase n=1 Tax=Ditylenchus destructor TaxID=166010 RepID=A0AAD4MZ02_9BILA|nr:fatty acid hydroxylase superfamily domain-containing protein [Ditylenchus destructor]
MDPLWGNASMSALIDRVFTNRSLGFRLLHRLDLANLRHIFYLITPYETSVATIEEVPNYNIQVSTWWMTLIFLEFIVLKLTGHDDRFALNDSMTSIFAGMLSQCFKFGGRSIAIFVYVFIWNNFRLIELPWDSAWTWLLCFVFQDFAYYLGHRAIHECGFFWGLHTIHHSSEYYNLSTALRQAAIQDAGLAAYDVLQAFCIPPPIFLVHRYFSEIFQFWMHTSLLGSLGPLGYVFNTPSHHRVHHGRNEYCIDRNFGGVLIIWDRMFHTFEAERVDDPPIYGLIKNERTFNQLWLQPGWFPEVEVYPFFHWFSLTDHSIGVPQIEYPVVKYNPPLKWWVKAYCLAHFLLLLCIFLHFEYDREELDYLDFTLKLAFFVCTMQSFGAFFDNCSYAPFLEIFRCVGVIAFYVIKLLLDGHGVLPNRIFMVTVFSSSAIFWIAYNVERALNRSKVFDETTEVKKTPPLSLPMSLAEVKIQVTDNSGKMIEQEKRELRTSEEKP